MAPKAHDPAQLALVAAPAPTKPRNRPGRRANGRHERALNAAVRERPELGEPVMSAAVSLARALAAALDTAEAAGKGYETSQLAGQYSSALDRLGLMPSTGGDPDAADPLDFGSAE